LDEQVINYLKTTAIDMIDQAKSGHPGIVLSAAPIMYSIYGNHLCIDPKDFENVNRDRFVMSAGHGSALLYATLHIFGFPIQMRDLKQFRQVNSLTPGHPENFITPGVEVTTGPLGQGVAAAVGLAIASKYQKLNNKIYVLVGDGDLMEGISYEALSLAGHLQLDNLIILYDANDVTLDGRLNKSFSEKMETRFTSLDFAYYQVNDGNNLVELNQAIADAKISNKPAFITVKTIIGQGTSVAGSNEAHGKPLKEEDIVNLKNKFNITGKFQIPDYIYEHAQTKLKERSNLQIELNDQINLDLLFSDLYQEVEELRISGGKILNRLAENNRLIFGGSADLGSSTKTYLNNLNNFSKNNYQGQNIWYGVREHAMGSITNGLALSGLRPFCSTFLVFADYLKPSIRLAALMNIPSLFIFTHDAISIGPDGPTHQPIEQLAMLRSIPNLDVFRPADIKEIEGVFKIALQKNNPSVIVLGRGKVKKQRNTRVAKVEKGAYIVRRAKNLHGIIIATGSEVGMAINVANELYRKRKLDLQVVSMPCRELFEKQSKKYQERLFPKGVRKIVLEAGTSFGWEGYVYNLKYLLTLNQFGCSGSGDDVLKKYHFDYDSILKKINKLL